MHSAGTDVGTDLAPPIPPKDLPLYQFLLAGGFGGISSVPLRRLWRGLRYKPKWVIEPH